MVRDFIPPGVLGRHNFPSTRLYQGIAGAGTCGNPKTLMLSATTAVPCVFKARVLRDTRAYWYEALLESYVGSTSKLSD